MAFNADTLTRVRTGEVYDYTTTDAIDAVTAAGYFGGAVARGLVRGTRIYVTTGGTTYETVVTGIAANGGATVANVSTIGAEATAAAIAAVGNAINTAGKRKHKIVFDTTNNRLMIASGPAAADPWYVVDGSVTVTPA